MATELLPTSRNINIPMIVQGVPRDNGLYKQHEDQQYHYGTRHITKDGRVFKYSGSKTALLSGFGAANYFAAANQNGAVLPAAVAVGDTKIAVTIASDDGYGGGAIAEDELVGGYVVMGHGESLVQNRLIVKNTAISTAGGTMYITVDGAIEQVMTISSSYCEILFNPYRYLGKGALQYNAFMCVPSQNVTSGYNFWGQTWGPCWVVPGGADTTPGNTIHDRMMYFVGDGSVNGGDYLAAAEAYQPAGFILDSTSPSISACPFIMLQISI
jgi:hypothetical protein